MPSKKFRVGVFASGNGTNAEEVFKYFRNHAAIEVALLMSNNPNAYALQRARTHGIKVVVFNRKEFLEGTTLRAHLKSEGITHIVLAGFLWLIPNFLVHSFPDRIINIHPALLPKYGGKGMYGSKIHEAVKASRDTETGITIHLVNDHYDEGKILFQEKCAIRENDTPQQIASCVLKLEHEHYPRVIEKWIMGDR